jgi:hypothetical protein
MKSFPTTRRPSQKLLVFARVPELGAVKTRLARTIGQERALEAYRAMISDLLRSLDGLSSDIEVEVLWSGTEAVDGAALRAAFGERALAMQAGATLEQRLVAAFSERIIFHRATKVIAIGIDEPSLPAVMVDHAFRLLDSCEWVLGPAADGGYYLVGCRGDAFRTEVFRDIPWGTDTVFARTRDKIRAFGASIAILPVRADIDLEDDLRAFPARAPEASAVAELVRRWGWS